MSGRRAAIAGFVAALLIPIVASAAEPDPRVYTSPTPAADWTVTIGGEARLEPIFQGSKRDLVLPYPILAVRRFGTPEPFRGPRDGVGHRTVRGQRFPGRAGRPAQDAAAGKLRRGIAGPRQRALGGRARRVCGILDGSLAAHPGRGTAGLQRAPRARLRHLRGRRRPGRHAMDVVRRPARHAREHGRDHRPISASMPASRRHRACRCSMPKAACARSAQVPRRVTSGPRSSRPMLSSNTNGSPATRPVRRWSSSAARRTS